MCLLKVITFILKQAFRFSKDDDNFTGKTHAFRDIDLKTPCGIAKCKHIKKDVVIVPILRAGLGMVEGVADLIWNTLCLGNSSKITYQELIKPHAESRACDSVLELVPYINCLPSSLHCFQAELNNFRRNWGREMRGMNVPEQRTRVLRVDLPFIPINLLSHCLLVFLPL